MWLIIGFGILGALVVLVGLSQRRGRRADLGFVSDQWVAEHRLSQTQDARR